MIAPGAIGPAVARHAAVRAAAAWSAGLVLLGLERAGAALSGTDVPITPASAMVLGAALVVGLAIAALAEALVALAAGGLSRFVPARVARWSRAALLAGLAVWPLARVGRALVRGDWIARQSWAPALRVAVPLGGALALLAVAGFVLSRLARPGARRLPLAIAAALAGLGALAADTMVLPGLYPAAHVTAFATGGLALLLAAGLAWARGLAADLRPRRLAIVAAILVVSLAAPTALLASKLVRRSRSNLMLASPRAAEVLPTFTRALRSPVLRRELQTLWQDGELARPLPPRARFVSNPDWNVVLITVDALRADVLPGFRRTARTRTSDVPFLSEWLRGTTRFERTYAQASQTKRSMPPMFRSSEPFEDPNEVASPLPSLMAERGHVPLAVVPQYFLEPAAAESHVLLDGFESVSVYGNETQDEMVAKVRQALAQNRGRPFFAWIHVYSMHHPCYAGRPTTPADGSFAHRYRLALRWTDGELRRIDGVLRELGLEDSSVVVLASDHGEPLGEHGRSSHGWTIYESDIRVPLALRIPGQPGKTVRSVVGNIDLVPTLFELIGARPDPDHRGHSLVPLLADPEARWELPYYVRSGIGNMHGVVFDDDKLIWDRDARLFVRFDVAADPRELRDRYDPDSRIDRALVRALLWANPSLAASELDDPETRALLQQRLRQANETTPATIRSFLLRLIALRPTPTALRAAERWAERSPDAAVTLDVVRELLEHDAEPLGRLLWRRLAAVQDHPEEVGLVEALADRRTPAFEVGRVAQRLDALSRQRPTRIWEPWLRLVQPWRKPTGNFVPPLARMLERSFDDDPTFVPLILEAIASTTPGRPLPEPVPARIEQMLVSPDLRVRLAAIHASRRAKGERIGAALAARFARTDLDLRERQALLHALGRVNGRAAVPAILAAGRDPILALDAVDELGLIGDPAALPFLRSVSKGPFPWYTQQRADRAIERLQKHR